MMTTRGMSKTFRTAIRGATAYSSAMFLQAIASIIPQVLPALGSLFGGMLKPNANGKDGAAPPSGNLLATLGNPEKSSSSPNWSNRSPARSRSASLAYRDASRSGRRCTRYPVPEFSEAKVAPALLAALPALMPIIEKVLNPETMKAIMENVSPAKLVGTVTDAVGTSPSSAWKTRSSSRNIWSGSIPA